MSSLMRYLDCVYAASTFSMGCEAFPLQAANNPLGLTLLGCQNYGPIMENQMEKKMENEMETGFI